MTIEPNANTVPPRVTPTVSAQLPDGSLVELVHNPKEAKTHLASYRDGQSMIVESIPTSSGTPLVPVSARNNLIHHGVLLLPERPVPFDSTEALVHDIEEYIARYVDLSDAFLRIASAYVLLSWVYDAFNELPYLRFRGDYGSGKTRALLVVGSICYKPFFASGASTISPIFHTLDTFGSTLIVDESDFRMSDEKAELVKIFNNGNVRGFPVLRSSATPQHTFDPRAFSVFGPKIVAMRHAFDDPALESRFLTEDMGKRPLRSGIPINLPDAQRDEAREMRNQLLWYRFTMLRSAAIDTTAYDDRLSPRTNQIVAPLLSVIGDQSLRTSIREHMARSEKSLRADRSASPEGQLLDVVLTLIGKDSEAYLAVAEITDAFIERFGKEYERPISPRYVGHLLRNRLRLATYKRHGNYVLPTTQAAHLRVLAERYGINVEAP
jgi:hypothetical protein